MRTTDLIRAVLDLIDQIEKQPDDTAETTVRISTDDEVRRFQQIAGLVRSDSQFLANEPAETYADTSAVTVNAGGGVNGPKNPADIRSNSVSMYPDFRARAKR